MLSEQQTVSDQTYLLFLVLSTLYGSDQSSADKKVDKIEINLQSKPIYVDTWDVLVLLLNIITYKNRYSLEVETVKLSLPVLFWELSSL